MADGAIKLTWSTASRRSALLRVLDAADVTLESINLSRTLTTCSHPDRALAALRVLPRPDPGPRPRPRQGRGMTFIRDTLLVFRRQERLAPPAAGSSSA